MAQKFKLAVDVAEGGRDLAKAQAAADAFGLGKKDPKYPRLKVIVKGTTFLPFLAGTVVMMNDDGIAKWKAFGLGDVTDEPLTEYRPMEVAEANQEETPAG